MEWKEDPEIWKRLRVLSDQSWPAMNDFLTRCSKYDIDPIAQTFLYGILGKFLATHQKALSEGIDDQEALALAVESVYSDPRFNQLAQNSINSKIDEVVGNVAKN